MRTLAVGGELFRQDLEGAFANLGIRSPAGAGYELGEVRVMVLVGEKYFIRTNTRVGVVVVAASDGRIQRIDVLHAGGAEGVLGIELGAGEDLEDKIFDYLASLAEQRGFRVRS